MRKKKKQRKKGKKRNDTNNLSIAEVKNAARKHVEEEQLLIAEAKQATDINKESVIINEIEDSISKLSLCSTYK